MSSIITVRKKIETTKSTRKITQAMQLVAANKMKMFERRARAARGYAQDLLKGLRISRGAMEAFSFAETRTSGKRVFVLLTSDKGLCGSLNNRLVNSLFNSEKWREAPEKERVLITVGKKSYEKAKAEGIEVAHNFDGIRETITPLEALKIVSTILKYWDDGVARDITLFSPHYVNPFETHITEKTYLPFSEDMIETHLKWDDTKDSFQEDYTGAIIEPYEERIALLLAYQLVETLFVQAFYELKASEYSSRMVAMKKATEAADDILERLTREYNKTRQAVITRELAELSAAGEVMKEAYA